MTTAGVIRFKSFNSNDIEISLIVKSHFSDLVEIQTNQIYSTNSSKRMSYIIKVKGTLNRIVLNDKTIKSIFIILDSDKSYQVKAHDVKNLVLKEYSGRWNEFIKGISEIISKDKELELMVSRNKIDLDALCVLFNYFNNQEDIAKETKSEKHNKNNANIIKSNRLELIESKLNIIRTTLVRNSELITRDRCIMCSSNIIQKYSLECRSCDVKREGMKWIELNPLVNEIDYGAESLRKFTSIGIFSKTVFFLEGNQSDEMKHDKSIQSGSHDASNFNFDKMIMKLSQNDPSAYYYYHIAQEKGHIHYHRVGKECNLGSKELLYQEPINPIEVLIVREIIDIFYGLQLKGLIETKHILDIPFPLKLHATRLKAVYISIFLLCRYDLYPKFKFNKYNINNICEIIRYFKSLNDNDITLAEKDLLDGRVRIDSDIYFNWQLTYNSQNINNEPIYNVIERVKLNTTLFLSSDVNRLFNGEVIPVSDDYPILPVYDRSVNNKVSCVNIEDEKVCYGQNINLVNEFKAITISVPYESYSSEGINGIIWERKDEILSKHEEIVNRIFKPKHDKGLINRSEQKLIDIMKNFSIGESLNKMIIECGEIIGVDIGSGCGGFANQLIRYCHKIISVGLEEDYNKPKPIKNVEFIKMDILVDKNKDELIDKIWKDGRLVSIITSDMQCDNEIDQKIKNEQVFKIMNKIFKDQGVLLYVIKVHDPHSVEVIKQIDRLYRASRKLSISKPASSSPLSPEVYLVGRMKSQIRYDSKLTDDDAKTTSFKVFNRLLEYYDYGMNWLKEQLEISKEEIRVYSIPNDINEIINHDFSKRMIVIVYLDFVNGSMVNILMSLSHGKHISTGVVNDYRCLVIGYNYYNYIYIEMFKTYFKNIRNMRDYDRIIEPKYNWAILAINSDKMRDIGKMCSMMQNGRDRTNHVIPYMTVYSCIINRFAIRESKNNVIDVGGRDGRHYDCVVGKRVIIIDTKVRNPIIKSGFNKISFIEKKYSKEDIKAYKGSSIMMINMTENIDKDLFEEVCKSEDVFFNVWTDDYNLEGFEGDIVMSGENISWNVGYKDTKVISDYDVKAAEVKLEYSQEEIFKTFGSETDSIEKLNLLLRYKPLFRTYN